ncbi:glycosyltransferase [Candidatus Woesebacteria bacterium]|nr:MAG: glycosyltransferase [Candidatus Woesebacteria bacterium]
MKHKISVIIPTLNEEKYIGNLLDDLSNQTLLPHEVIVVDAKSVDKTKKVVTTHKLKPIFHIHKKGVVHQRNFGIAQSTGEIIILMDADVRINEKFIENSLHQFYKHDLHIACPNYRADSKHPDIKLCFAFINSIFVVTQKFAPSGAGMCIITTKSHVIKHGGFDETYNAYEDWEFIRRLGRKGKFKILKTYVKGSDRRFVKEGVIKVMSQYTILTLLHCLKMKRVANKIPYKFGGY